ncbi:hypothetical protein [Sulfuricurvum sp.]|uniref:hypothetical protein n=1 Tax=Sulfuricurvum sp. TaxID=2025608 RepID=UPI00356671C9
MESAKTNDNNKNKVAFVIECTKGHKSQYFPKNGVPAKDIKCPHLVANIPCKARCKVIDTPAVPPVDVTKEEPKKTTKPEKAKDASTTEPKEKPIYKTEELVDGVADDVKAMFAKIESAAKSSGLTSKPTKLYVLFKKDKDARFKIEIHDKFLNVFVKTEKAITDLKDKTAARDAKGDNFTHKISKVLPADESSLMKILKIVMS